MTQAEATKHLRKRIQVAGIKARVRQLPASKTGLQVFPIAYGVEFSVAEQRTIRLIAQVNNLTLARGMAIVVDQDTDPFGIEFHVCPGLHAMIATGRTLAGNDISGI